jgi:two-component system, OmpR family, response regulator
LRSPPRILAVDDVPTNLEILKVRLEAHGYEVVTAADGEEALARARELEPDLVLLDIMMPKLDGISVLKQLKQEVGEHFVPVILVTAKADTRDIVAGLEAGGDDYLTKPFEFIELTARLDALTRRHDAPQSAHRYEIGPLKLDLLAREVTCVGRPVALLPREYRLLEYLVRHAGQVVSRTMLFEAVWDYRLEERTNVIDVHISRLRKKLDPEGTLNLIETVRGSGYMLRASH